MTMMDTSVGQVRIQDVIRPMVRGIYDLQKLRVQTGNRIVANFKAKLGQAPGTPEEELTEEQQDVLKEIKAAFARVTDGVVKKRQGSSLKPEQFNPNEVIGSYAEYVLIEQYIGLESREKDNFRQLGEVLETIPVYNQYLSKIMGIGPAMAGCLISEIDIAKAKYCTQVWAYCGYDVVVNPATGEGEGRSKRKEHLVQRDYVDKEGEVKQKLSITYNPWIKTKLYTLASSLMRAGNEQYRKVYDDYKFRLTNHPKHKEKTPKHRHNMAIRYVIKNFLGDLYRAWRTIEGLPVYSSYAEGKLGMVHTGDQPTPPPVE